ncbi:hypothetical protein [Prevotella sp. P6B4]|uniref:hypothetical protein n=1 Tax=Prevotella sp. P6B4 TaxID=1410614 RepID=UPI0004909205|nr:hypothetical protein [Prevotella sp. P6B4]
MDYFIIQDIYHKRMKEDYERGLIITNPIYKPFFEWKFYGASVDSLTKQMCYKIMDEAQRELEKLDLKHPNGIKHLLEESTVDDVWRPYKGYGDDCYLYSYLTGIENEITTILLIKHG